MALAIAVTLAQDGLENFALDRGSRWGSAPSIGVVGARSVKMTAMPQMVALFNGVGGGAVALIALAEFHNLRRCPAGSTAEESVAILLSALIGSISFSGSLIAFAKLQELLSGRPIVYRRAAVRERRGAAVRSAIGALIVAGAEGDVLVVALIVAALVFGVLFVLPIGGADMPVVISLLNAFTGLAASAAGFLLHNNVLIVAGALVGASGTLLTLLMGRAMNRSIGNVLFGAFGAVQAGGGGAADEDGRSVRATTAEDLAIMLGYARKVVFVPGYGLAVAQAQHDVRALAELLEHRGIDVLYGIHPVAGRMPGHMNVLLAEAERALRPAEGDGRDQPRAAADGRGRHPRRQRRRQPGRALRPEQPDLRDADHRGRPRRQRSSSSSGRSAPASPASTTRFSTTRRPRCSSPTRSKALEDVSAALKAL